MPENKDKHHVSAKEAAITLLLCLSILAVYWQVHDFEFVNYDDGSYVSQNLHVQKGLTLKNIIWAFATYHASNWHPITWLSHMLDVTFFGMNPGAFHMMNVFYHIINTLLLFAILYKMTRAVWRSAVVAFLFALHPLHVESVVWIAERKDVLCTFWGFATMLIYIEYLRHPNALRYMIMAISFALGLMSKPMLVTFPIMLMLLDFWPLGRLQPHQPGTIIDRMKAYRVFREKGPLFCLVFLSCLVTFIAQYRGGAVRTFETYSLYTRFANAASAYLIYIWKIFLPTNLCVFYPHPQNIPLWQFVSALIILLLITLAVTKLITKWPFLFVGWLWYIITLVPVIGIIQVGAQAYADRYTYIPSVGIFIMVVWGISELFSRYQIKAWLTGGLTGFLILSLMYLSFHQIRYWKDSETLFTHAIKVSNRNYIAHINLGSALSNQGRIEDAIFHFRKGIEFYPMDMMAHCNLGLSLMEQSRYEESIDCFQTVLTYTPDNRDAYYYMGYSYVALGMFREGISSFEKLFELAPDYRDFKANYGFILVKKGQSDEALRFFKYAMQLKSDFSMVIPEERDAETAEALQHAVSLHENGRIEDAKNEYLHLIADKGKGFENAVVNCGVLLGQQGRMAEGLVYFNKALDLNYMPPELFNNFGVANLRQEKLVEAVRYLSEAIRRKPDDSIAHNNLGVALFKQGRYGEAMKEFQIALNHDQTFLRARNNLKTCLSFQNKIDGSNDVLLGKRKAAHPT